MKPIGRAAMAHPIPAVETPCTNRWKWRERRREGKKAGEKREKTRRDDWGTVPRVFVGKFCIGVQNKPRIFATIHGTNCIICRTLVGL